MPWEWRAPFQKLCQVLPGGSRVTASCHGCHLSIPPALGAEMAERTQHPFLSLTCSQAAAINEIPIANTLKCSSWSSPDLAQEFTLLPTAAKLTGITNLSFRAADYYNFQGQTTIRSWKGSTNQVANTILYNSIGCGFSGPETKHRLKSQVLVSSDSAGLGQRTKASISSFLR